MKKMQEITTQSGSNRTNVEMQICMWPGLLGITTCVLVANGSYKQRERTRPKKTKSEQG